MRHVVVEFTDRFDDESLLCEMVVTVDLETVFCGTELRIVQEGIKWLGEL